MKYITLYLLSRLYLCIITIYNALYKLKILKTARFSVPLMSIGNISMGGSGKTPMVICFSKLLHDKNIKHVIVSRGYKKNSKGTVLVSDGIKPVSDFVENAYMCGDEAYLMAVKLPNTPVVVGENKINAIKFAIKKFNPNLILLDDAFQSSYLNINYSVLLYDCSLKKSELQLLPLGKLRQPLRAAKKADIILLTKGHEFYFKRIKHHEVGSNMLLSKNSSSLFINAEQFLSKWVDCPITYKYEYTTTLLELVGEAFVDTNSLGDINVNTGAGRKKLPKRVEKKKRSWHDKAFVFCGLANPNVFLKHAKLLCSNIVLQKTYKDHFEYKNSDLFQNDCNKAVRVYGANTFLTTYKDFVKLKNDPFFKGWKVVWKILDIEYHINENSEIVDYIDVLEKNLTKTCFHRIVIK